MSGSSLRKRLTWLNISLMFCVLVPVGVFSYERESSEMGRVLDGRLAETGRTISALVSRGTPLSLLTPAADQPGGTRRAVVSVDINALEPSVGYQVLDPHGVAVVVTTDFDGLPPPTHADLGFRTATFNGTPWRLFTLRSRSGYLVRIGERDDAREEIMHGLIIEHGFPLLIGLPLLAVLLSVAVRQGLRPLSQLTDQLRGRTVINREPVVMASAIAELRPLIDTLNQQFERLQDALERERQFSADVAHELRTPLAAAMIQLENAELATDRTAARFAIGDAELSLTRLARRIEQILALSRLEIGAATVAPELCDLVELIKESIEELAPTIAEKDIETSFDYEGAEARIPGHEASLMAMFRNLIENALRYVPPQGRVAVSLVSTPQAIVVEVGDNGPGIPAEHHAAVFKRFHRESHDRTGGLGLGLSIVAQAAKRHGARIELSQPPIGTGLIVRVTLPRSTTSCTT